MSRHTKTTNETKKKIWKFLPIIVMIIMGIVLKKIVSASGDTVSLEMILKYTPKDTAKAVLILWMFFALKSLSLVFPIALLYLASGILFSPGVALLVSATGLMISHMVPYLIGRFSGADMLHMICSKYEKAKKLAEYQNKNQFFVCFITRIVGVLPQDIVSLYLGACKIPFGVYLPAGAAGALLSIVTTTLLGNKLDDPFSVEFIVVLICRILVSAFAILAKRKLYNTDK